MLTYSYDLSFVSSLLVNIICIFVCVGVANELEQEIYGIVTHKDGYLSIRSYSPKCSHLYFAYTDFRGFATFSNLFQQTEREYLSLNSIAEAEKNSIYNGGVQEAERCFMRIQTNARG